MKTHPGLSERSTRNVLLLIGGVHVGLAGWAAVDAGSFARTIADFGPQNDHLVHDFAACAATFGLGMLIAARFPSWRPAALTLAAAWTGLHAIAHVADAADAQPATVGPVEAAVLLVLSAVLAALAYDSSRSAATTLRTARG